MTFIRTRRLRQSPALRDFAREYELRVADLIYPQFIIEGEGIRHEIGSMPGKFHISPDRLPAELD